MSSVSNIFIPAEKVVYTDGSCSGNVGGYAWITLDDDTCSGKLYPATNQMCELYAIYSALSSIKGDLDIYTDSAYSIGCLTKWAPAWKLNGWKTAKGTPVKHKEIIENCLLHSANRRVRFFHVKAHTGNRYNEIADELANKARLI